MQKWLEYSARPGAENHSVVGTIKVLEGLWSPELENERDIFVYLPPSYNESLKRYPVIYMHDGQNLFDEQTSYAGEWGVDETMEALSREGLEAIVVGIPNMGYERAREYSPFSHSRFGPGKADDYLRFIVETLKPLIDQSFRTLPDRRNTGILGSSMGALVSLYALVRYGHIFGLVGMMSPSLWVGGGKAFRLVAAMDYQDGRVYLDTGTAEGPGGRDENPETHAASRRYVADARRLRDLLRERGYHSDTNFMYVEERRGSHHESAWSRRLPAALRFLLAGAQKK